MIPNKDAFKNKDFEPWKVSVYRKEPALPGSLLRSKGTLKFSVAALFQLINGKVNLAGGLKQNSSTSSYFMAAGGIVSLQTKLLRPHFTDSIKYSKFMVK